MIEPIERPDDPRIAAYARVGDHRWLRARGLFVAEGRLVVERLFELGRFEIESIAVTPAAFGSLQPLLEQAGAPVFVCAPAILESVTGFDFHRGCLALVRRPEEGAAEQFAGATRLLALEGIGNPDNIGGLFRVAAAFGAEGIVLSPACADPFYRKSIRTSMGAVLRVPFATAAGWPDDLGVLRAAGMQIVALTPDRRAATLHGFSAALDASARLVFLLGAEGPGLTPVALQCADHLVRIPIDEDVDSLNVAVAAGIALAFTRTPRRP